MDCCEFREKYSDMADGLLAPSVATEARVHLSHCPACQRFDAALRAGVELLRGLPSVGVSRGFGPTLRRRLRGELAVRMPGAFSWSGAVGALLLVATAGFVGWDWMESRAAHQTAAAWTATDRESRTAVLAAEAKPAFPPLASFPSPLRLETYHPLNAFLVVVPSEPLLIEDHARFDVPAVWGGP